ncbi:MAG: acyltransferase family protein [Myxococcales bacterium]|nr:acyltransferase family protein [Myxococcales bacterium]
MTVHIERPSGRELELALAMLEPWRRVTRPTFEGLERVPDEGPLLFVGNHTLFGVLDVPLFFGELYQRKGIFLRALADHAHYRLPVWRDLLTRFGAVDGTRENCAALMRAGEPILVFPGGGREVAKRKGERYQLIWKERLGFARLAIAHRCTIVPFAATGVEGMFDIVLDANDFLATPIGKAYQRLGLRADIVPPLVRAAGSTLLPRPAQLHFQIGAPIRAAEHGGDPDDTAAAKALRDVVRAAVRSGIDDLLDRYPE